MKKRETDSFGPINGLKKALTFGALSMGVSMIPLAHAFAIDDNALPSGGSVTHGQATLDYTTPGELHVHQGSNLTVIDWNSFNIGQNSLTQFHQPGSGSIAVNRVTGSQDPTQILGTLRSNGIVMVLDRNGVIFGQNSVIDVGSIIASTGNIDDNAFMSGHGALEITDIDTGGAIINEGTISVADAGLAAFVAPTIVNKGVIQAKLGKISLASGTMATLDLYGDGLVEVAADQPLQEALINNEGMITADGGTVVMTAAAVQNTVNSVINTSGIVSVASVTQKGGKIVLEGPSIEVSGTLDASGKTGGGVIHVGGEWQGGGTTRHADNVDVKATAIIKASATGMHGDGGEVVLWSDRETKFAGTIEAQGGSVSGNGGKVETSSKKHLQVGQDAIVTVGAGNSAGNGGEWLIDPEDIAITTSGNDGNAATSDISTTTINNTLNAGGNVTITTNGASAGSGDITLQNATILKSTANNNVTLRLNAHRNIVMSSSSISATADHINVVLNADYDGNQDGAIFLSSTPISTNGGWFVAGGGSGTLWGADGIKGTADDATSTGADNVAAWGNATYANGVHLSSSALSTVSGDIFINGHGWSGSTATDLNLSAAGVRVNASNITTQGTGIGHIRINGTGGGTGAGNSNIGIYVLNSAAITTYGGTMTLNGTGGGGSGALNIGVALSSVGTNFVRTTTGAINITGQASGTNAAISTTGRIDSLGSGSITLTSTGGRLATGNTVGGASATGNITYVANEVDISGGSVRTTGTVQIKPYTDTTNINLGAGTTGLALSNAELGRIHNAASKVIIGDSTNAQHDITIDGLDVSALTYGFELYGNDITIQDTAGAAGYGLRLGSGNFMAHAIDKDTATIDKAQLTVNAAITKAVAGTSLLDLRSDRDIIFSSGNVTASGTAILNTVLNADRDADQDGAINISNSTITTNGGWFVAGGGSGTLWGSDGIRGNADDATSTGADKVAAWGNDDYQSGFRITNGGINTAAGNIIINGHGSAQTISTNNGISLITTAISTTGNGSITMTGIGGGSGTTSSSNNGIGQNSGSLSTGAGAITLNGTGGLGISGSGSYGVAVTNVTSTSGAINVNGMGGTSGSLNHAIRMSSGSINSGSGLLTITGIAGLSGSDLSLTGGNIGGTGQTGDIILNINTAGSIGSVYTTTGKIIIKPRTASRNIAVGGTGSDLNLSDAFLGNLNAGTLIIGDAINGTGDIFVESWDLSGKTHAVELYGNDITIQDTGAAAGYGLRLGSGNFTAHAKDNGTTDLGGLNVNAAISKSGTGTSALTLRADQNIIFATGTGISVTTGILDTDLHADYDADQDGILSLNNGAISTHGGNLTLTAGSGASGNNGISLSGTSALNTAGGTLTLGQKTTITAAQTWNAGAGEISLNGPIVTNNNDLTLIADGINIGGTITTTGTLTIKPYTVSASIGLGGGSGLLNLTDAELGYLSAGTLIIGDAANGSGDVDINSWNLSSKTHNVQIHGGNIDLGGITMGTGNVALYSKGSNGITVSAAGTSNATGNLSLLSMYDVAVDAALGNAGSGHINIFAGWDGLSGLTTPALFSTDAIDFGLTARNVTLGTNGSLSSGGTGTAVLVATKGNFTNGSNAGANAIATANGRYLVYNAHPDTSGRGLLAAKNLYNAAYGTALPATIAGGSRFVYAFQPTLTLKADDISAANTASATYSYSATSGLRSDDLLSDALSGTPTYTLGAQSGNSYPIQLGAGTLASEMGYALALTNGTLTVTAPVVIPPVTIPVIPPMVSAIKDSTLNHAANVPKISIPASIQPPAAAATSMKIAEMKAEEAAAGGNTQQTHKDGENDGVDHKGSKDAKQTASADCLLSEMGSGGCIIN